LHCRCLSDFELLLCDLAPMEMCSLSSAAHVERSQVSLSASRVPNDSCISFRDFQVSDKPSSNLQKAYPLRLLWPPHTMRSFVQCPQLFYRLWEKHIGAEVKKTKTGSAEHCSCGFSPRVRTWKTKTPGQEVMPCFQMRPTHMVSTA
jgi:hypothetical protein